MEQIGTNENACTRRSTERERERVVFLGTGKIGACASKPAGAERALSAEVGGRLSPPVSGSGVAAAAPVGLSNSKSEKMKGIFKSKSRTPVHIVRLTRDLLIYVDRTPSSSSSDSRDSKREEKMAELSKTIRELKSILYGNSDAEPVSEACAQFTDELFRETLCLLARKDATQIVASLQRQQVNSRLIASQYLEKNSDLLDALIAGYENTDIALHYGAMLRSAYVTKVLQEYNSKLLESSNYITRRQAVKLLGDILLDHSNSVVMTRYVSSRDNLRILMNLLRESSKSIQIEAFHVFKLFAANQNKPPDISSTLIANRSKLLRLFADFKIDKEDEQFEADKALVVKEIAALEPRDRP